MYILILSLLPVLCEEAAFTIITDTRDQYINKLYSAEILDWLDNTEIGNEYKMRVAVKLEIISIYEYKKHMEQLENAKYGFANSVDMYPIEDLNRNFKYLHENNIPFIKDLELFKMTKDEIIENWTNNLLIMYNIRQHKYGMYPLERATAEAFLKESEWLLSFWSKLITAYETDISMMSRRTSLMELKNKLSSINNGNPSLYYCGIMPPPIAYWYFRPLEN